MRILALLIAGAAIAVSGAARADVLDTVNWARLRGCKPPAQQPLQSNVRLRRAAGRLARGTALSEALAREEYVGSEFSELHFSGAVNDAQITHTLTAAYCRTLTNAKFRELGTARRGGELWMVLAAPVSMPAAVDAAGVSRRMLSLVNEARAAGRRCGTKYFAPAGPLTLNDRLTGTALAHSREMAQYAEFEHRGHDGSTPALRVRRAGYGKYTFVGENIAAGAMTAPEAVQGWLASPAHCENIMDGRFRETGIAYAASHDPAVGMYWTQDFAAPR